MEDADDGTFFNIESVRIKDKCVKCKSLSLTREDVSLNIVDIESDDSIAFFDDTKASNVSNVVCLNPRLFCLRNNDNSFVESFNTLDKSKFKSLFAMTASAFNVGVRVFSFSSLFRNNDVTTHNCSSN